MIVHFVVSVLLNSWKLKLNLFVSDYVHTMECVQHMYGIV